MKSKKYLLLSLFLVVTVSFGSLARASTTLDLLFPDECWVDEPPHNRSLCCAGVNLLCGALSLYACGHPFSFATNLPSLFLGQICGGIFGAIFDCDAIYKRCLNGSPENGPNEIIGSNGYGNERWIRKNEILPYLTIFKNGQGLATTLARAVSASIPVKKIFIKQTLDSDLDISTYGGIRLTEVEFVNILNLYALCLF